MFRPSLCPVRRRGAGLAGRGPGRGGTAAARDSAGVRGVGLRAVGERRRRRRCR
ncbi:MAG: hypothetical protein MZW92_19360 [Comamonadaceae bacterium]|nr:hypothetical protein [Comamonadaceae bacterium]